MSFLFFPESIFSRWERGVKDEAHSFFWLPKETSGTRGGGRIRGACNVLCEVGFLPKSALWENIIVRFFV